MMEDQPVPLGKLVGLYLNRIGVLDRTRQCGCELAPAEPTPTKSQGADLESIGLLHNVIEIQRSTWLRRAHNVALGIA
jgi:hypothetical protein